MSKENAQDVTPDQVPRISSPASSSALSPSVPRNAFMALMSKDRKEPTKPASPHPTKQKSSIASRWDPREGLGKYIDQPENSHECKVIFYNDGFVAINDLYPKSSVHCLLLPRSPQHQRMHPFEAFEDAEFLRSVRENAARLKSLVAKELQRKYAPFSAQERTREAVLNGDVRLQDGEELPIGRDWEQEVMVGIHAHPSMNHLHIHVLSVDRFSDKMRHKKHYNSFTTPFLVDLDAFPLPANDARRHPGQNGYLKSNLKCWRCGEEFGVKFADLKKHLAVEFEKWKRE